MIEAVTFDLWETLICDAPENRHRGRALRVRRLGELLAQAGHPQPEERLAWAHDETGRRWEGLWTAGREDNTSGHLAIFLGYLGVPAEAVSAIRPALEELRARGAGMWAILLGAGRVDGADAAVWTLDQVPEALDGLQGRVGRPGGPRA